jgi:Tol biopolymer transport system component
MYLRALREVVERQVFSGEERVVFDAATHGMSNLTSFGPSPDGRSIALSGWMDKTQAALLVYTPAGGPREMFRSSSLVVFQAWAPDAQQILFTLLDEQPHTLMRIPSSGGEPIDMQLPIHGFTQVNFTALSPDGRRLAYTAGQPGIQVWMMERFLPR